MRNIGLIGMLFATSLALLSGTSRAQESLRAQVFEEADSARARAAAAAAETFAPRNWRLAVASYGEADALFRKGESLNDVREKLRSSISYLRIAVQVCQQFESLFSTALIARDEAASAHAETHVAELWGRANVRLQAAGQQLEDGNLSAARNEAGEAEGLYRAAGLESIKTTTLARAGDLLKRADAMDVRKSAPRTLNRARTLYARAAALLQANRYDNAEARRLAEDAAEEAAHAIYIHQYIVQLKRQDKGTEDVVLASEEPVRKIADALGVAVQFDAGLDIPLTRILQSLHREELKDVQLRDTLKIQALQIAALKKRIAALKRSLPAAAAADDDDLLREAQNLQKFDAAIARISSQLAPSDGTVVRDGNNVILRVHGVSFGPGNTIETRSFQLLAKIQDAIKEFPGCQISVEGHAEASGSEIACQLTTEARAEAVAQYLKANLPPTIPVLSHGYGSTRPITASTTAEGNALNRRIEIVIVPEWAIVGR